MALSLMTEHNVTNDDVAGHRRAAFKGMAKDDGRPRGVTRKAGGSVANQEGGSGSAGPKAAYVLCEWLSSALEPQDGKKWPWELVLLASLPGFRRRAGGVKLILPSASIDNPSLLFGPSRTAALSAAQIVAAAAEDARLRGERLEALLEVISLMARMPPEVLMPAITVMLKRALDTTEDPRVRIEALRALEPLPLWCLMPHIRSLLKGMLGLLGEGPALKAAASSIVSRIPDHEFESVAAEAAATLNNTRADDKLVISALEMLARMPESVLGPHAQQLSDIIRDRKNTRVKSAALEAIARCPSNSLGEDMCKALESVLDNEGSLRALAVRALGKALAAVQVMRALNDQKKEVRIAGLWAMQAVAQAAKTLPDEAPGAIARLAGGDEDREVARTAGRVLAAMPTCIWEGEAERMVTRLANTTCEDNRTAVLIALAALPREVLLKDTIISALDRLMIHDWSEEVRTKSMHILSSLGGLQGPLRGRGMLKSRYLNHGAFKLQSSHEMAPPTGAGAWDLAHCLEGTGGGDGGDGCTCGSVNGGGSAEDEDDDMLPFLRPRDQGESWPHETSIQIVTPPPRPTNSPLALALFMETAQEGADGWMTVVKKSRKKLDKKPNSSTTLDHHRAHTTTTSSSSMPQHSRDSHALVYYQSDRRVRGGAAGGGGGSSSSSSATPSGGCQWAGKSGRRDRRRL